MSPVARSPRSIAPPPSVPDRTVDTRGPVVSSPAIGGAGSGTRIRPVPPAEVREGHERVAVGPGTAGPLLRAGVGGYRMNPLQIQPAKIHCPPPRDDTLSRERLNSWLDRAAGGRLGLIVAEAGFGKTTLLADWALHARRLTTWYRLEPDDRDWLTFIRHLVAGGRELDAEFAPETFRMLHALGPGGPSPGDLTVSIARELAEFGAGSAAGLTLLVDDYHVVDGFPETDAIMKALLDRTGPGFSVVIATRSMPGFPIGRLRARGGVMTLDGDDLCFDVDETSRLFRDAYRRPLDEDVVHDLFDRTEGWAALLTLVRTGLEDRESSDPRALIAHLDASRGDLYEFLAEEVMGSLSPELQHFLTRVAVLMAVDVDTARLVDDRPTEAIQASIRESERLGLLSRPDRESPHRFHHLVREFLVARLTAEIGEASVRALHRSIAERLRDTDWYAAAWHFLMAGEKNACESVVDGALDEIIASGLFEQVRPFLEPEAGDPERPVALILRSRDELARGRYPHSEALARRAVASAAHIERYRGAAMINLAATVGLNGMNAESERLALAALAEPLSPSQRDVAQATLALRGAAGEGDLRMVADTLAKVAVAQERDGQLRYAGVSRLNLSGALIWLGDLNGALREATLAEVALGGLASPTVERVAATTARAVALAHLGRLSEARVVLDGARAAGSALSSMELASEQTRIETELGSLERAEATLPRVNPDGLDAYWPVHNVSAAQIALRRGDPDKALRYVELLGARPVADAAGLLRGQLVRARVAIARGDPDSRILAVEAHRIAEKQASNPGVYLSRLLSAFSMGEGVDDAVMGAEPRLTYCWSLLAEEVSAGLDQLSVAALERVAFEAAARPERWRTSLRLTTGRLGSAAQQAATLMASIGTDADAAYLRALSTSRKTLRGDALAITRRLARSIHIHDLGAVDVRLDGNVLPRGIRRRVLALVCFVSSKPGMAASRDEVLETLWPELSPDAAGNSLHQAIYYLRRILEPDFKEWASASYVTFDGDVVSLDADLVDSDSRICWRLVRRADPDAVSDLVSRYAGRYALDFAYEDWATDYRETLHAAVLSAVEGQLRQWRLERDFARAIQVGQAMLAVDPQADPIELELLRTYKESGRQAAAAEQYAHYAAFVREELAAEPPSFDDL